MAEPFLGEIRLFAFPRIPTDWLPCDGRLLNIAQNQALFALIGNKYGGDGKTTFALPDLRGRVPVHYDNRSTRIGVAGGAENVTLTPDQLPAHSHTLTACDTAGNKGVAVGSTAGYWFAKPVPAQTSTPANKMYATATTGFMPLPSDMVQSAGGGQGHPNCQPTLPMNYCIAVQGFWPPRD